MGDLTKNFSAWEFECKCGCGTNKMSAAFLSRIQTTRDYYGYPMTVRSGARCAKHNAKVGGKVDSEHVPDPNTGESDGADIAWKGSRSYYFMNRAAYHAFSRIGEADSFLHLGCRTSKNQNVTWRYPSKEKQGSFMKPGFLMLLAAFFSGLGL